MKKAKRILPILLCMALLLSLPVGAANVIYNELPIVPPHSHTYVYTDNGNGTHTVTCTGCDYSETVSHTYANGVCVCGSRETVERPKIISAAPSIDENVNLVFTVSVPAGYSDPYMVFSFHGTSTTVRDYTTDSGKLKFTFDDITPQCMGDTISATLYASKNGTQESDSVASYSVRSYCVNMLARTGNEAISTSLRRLLSDLLAYGAAAQTYTNYKTDALVTAGSDIRNTDYGTYETLSGLAPVFDGTAASDVYWTAASLTLTSSVAMNFRFHADSVQGLTVYVDTTGRTQTYTSFTSLGSGLYEISFTDINADEFGSTVTATFKRDSKQLGNTVSYSVNTYIQSKQADSNAALAALVKALYNYGVSAKAYVG
ncbi:MAG: hypothetical protein II875_15070 [Clostridia bacterium]|nr:hypothetical protein [Oscillospiraceae bacterium]MBQ3763306.1 hypothetical protein [Clostridia bacterium]